MIAYSLVRNSVRVSAACHGYPVSWAAVILLWESTAKSKRAYVPEIRLLSIFLRWVVGLGSDFDPIYGYVALFDKESYSPAFPVVSYLDFGACVGYWIYRACIGLIF